MAFPCNQFGAQESVSDRRIARSNAVCRVPLTPLRRAQGTHEHILNFVEEKFGAKDKFAWFAKGHVNGKDTREAYSFLKSRLPAEDGTTDIRWNFAKFLVDHEGAPFKRYGPKTEPKDLVPDIEELLKRKEAAAGG